MATKRLSEALMNNGYRELLKGDPGRDVELQVTDTHLQWRYPDGEWNDLVSLEGIKGPEGDKGIIGDQGIQGPVGDKGPAGDKGEQGNKGVQGDPGVKGADGDQGPVGSQGPAGDQGLPGEQGQTGEQGIKGVDGDKGATGDKGPEGDAGPQGIQGPVGDQGIQGSQGPAGDKGPDGDQGVQGDKGPTGDAGTSNFSIIIKSGTTANSTTNLANCDGLTFVAAANKTYLIEVFLIWDTSATTVGIRATLSASAAVTRLAGHFIADAAAGTPDSSSFNASNVVTTTSASAFTTNNMGVIRAVLVNSSSANTIWVRFAAETTGTITVNPGSVLRYTLLN